MEHDLTNVHVMKWAFFAPRTWLRFMKRRKIPGYGETKAIHLPKETSLVAETKIAKLGVVTRINKKVNNDRKRSS